MYFDLLSSTYSCLSYVFLTFFEKAFSQTKKQVIGVELHVLAFSLKCYFEEIWRILYLWCLFSICLPFTPLAVAEQRLVICKHAMEPSVCFVVA